MERLRKVTISMFCIMEVLLVIGSMTACTARNGGAAPYELVNPNETDEGRTGTSETYIGTDSAEMIALNHAGFSETEVSLLKCEFDIDDGLAVYEVEFDKDGREYEYTINAVDGSIIEYDVD